MNKPYAFVLIILCFAMNAFTLGDKEKGDFQPAQGLENWQHKYDISKYPEGKYNIVIRGTDKAGNAAYAGPFDIYIDPKSAIPEVSIRNPGQGSKVGSHLNILGTAIDDKSIKLVEIKIDDGDYKPADGKEYWSFYANFDALPDGKHTLTARCTDIDDNPSVERSVVFHLDKKAPETKITSLKSGTLVAGDVNIQGSVTDLNGLKSLFASIDGRKHFTPVGFDFNNLAQAYLFEYKIDTRRIQDGPLVVWIKGVDTLGVIGYSAFLLFVNNQKPSLDIIYPQENANVNGTVKVFGRVLDKIGIKSLTYDLGNNMTGTIGVTPGNPYWTQNFDFKAFRTGTIEISFIAENFTGIKETKRLRIRIDEEQDKPVATIAYPENNAVIGTETTISGFVRDDDGVKSIDYSLDRGSSASVECTGTFVIPFTGLKSGKHTVSIKPIDINGVPGKPVETSFTSVDKPPYTGLTTLAIEKEETGYYPGILVTLPAKGRAALRGSIVFPNGVEKAEYRIGDEKVKYQNLDLRKGDSDISRTFEIELRKELPEGRNNISIVATDKSKLTSEYLGFFYKTSVTDIGGIYFYDARIKEDNRIVVTGSTPLTGFFNDPDSSGIKSVETMPQTDAVKLDTNGNTIVVSSAKEGISIVQIKVTGNNGKIFASEKLTIVTDTSGPEVEVKKPLAGACIGNSFDFEATVKDSIVVKSIEYAVKDPKVFIPIPFTPQNTTKGFNPAAFASTGSNFTPTGASSATILATAKIPDNDIEDGNLLLIIKVTDSADNISFRYIPILKDTKPPEIILLAPLENDELHGLATLFGYATDSGYIDKIEFTDDNKTFTRISTGSFFEYHMVLSKYGTGIPKELAIKATDTGKNVSTINPKLTVNLAAVKPRVEIQIPGSGEVMRDDFVISGMAFDDAGVREIQYRIDKQEFQKTDGINNFSIPVQIANLSDSLHSIDVKAINVNGIESDIAKSSFVISKAEPESKLLSPSINDFVRKIVELKGASSDLNGIKEVFVSFDNGLTFNRASGTEQWTYRLDTTLLEDGTRSIFVKAVDKADTEGYFNTTINIDNHVPLIKCDSPAEGDMVTQSLVIDGKASDNIGLSSLELVISPVLLASANIDPLKKMSDAAPGKDTNTKNSISALFAAYDYMKNVKQEAMKYTLSTSGIFNQSIDISKLAPGWYNVEITAADKANNITYTSRNILVKDSLNAGSVELLFPSKGETLAGFFNLSGKIVTRTPIEKVTIIIDNIVFGVADVNNHGYFNRTIGPDEMKAGDHIIRVEALFPGNARVSSEEAKISYTRIGPWVTVTNVSTGDFVSGRPFVQGKAGFYIDPVSDENREAFEAYKKQLDENRVERVSMSFDNGSTFVAIDGQSEWRYRIEAYKLPPGGLRPIVRADFANNTSALAKVLLDVDNKPPDIVVTTPQEGKKYNESVLVSGTASDANGLDEISVSLRQGDKGQYSLPSFVQGMYIDAHALGATVWETGLGFTFFDENIKLEGLCGMGRTEADQRVTGLAVGGKLIANIATIPFSYFFGPDWSFFSMSVGLGACFTYFTNQGTILEFSNQSVIESGIVAQLEFAKFTIPDWKMFRSYSFYFEFQLWTISSDVEPAVYPNYAFGFRLGIF